MSSSTESLYLRDLGGLLKEMALRAKKEALSASEADRGFALGRLMAMHEVISLMQQQADAFGLDVKDIGLEEISPEQDLV
ncbi:hypothetical protein [Polyangium sorediatum]|uniref:Transposase n=1 Tax=Polyangium sorediatum TaxID=889274 RepID=A0ABT6NYA6_9BACT|nr:hypothetical protein [Polyangium sorediatum]MDI1433326.1 hypothetical protein [Polyangium sorediatum]